MVLWFVHVSTMWFQIGSDNNMYLRIVLRYSSDRAIKLDCLSVDPLPRRQTDFPAMRVYIWVTKTSIGGNKWAQVAADLRFNPFDAITLVLEHYLAKIYLQTDIRFDGIHLSRMTMVVPCSQHSCFCRIFFHWFLILAGSKFLFFSLISRLSLMALFHVEQSSGTVS